MTEGTTPREPETLAGQAMLERGLGRGWSPLTQDDAANLLLAIEAELRAKLAAEVGHLHFGPGYAITLDEQGWDSAIEAVQRLLRGDSGGAA